jgi:acetylornithine/succinyldiaminopimelate/putrescine aminotransferase
MKEVIGQVRVASQAQVMSRAMRQMCSVFKKANHCVIFTNQERSNIDTMGRGLGRKTTPGGAAVKFYSAMRIQMEAVPPGITVETMNPVTGKVNKEIVALNIRVKTIKNRFAPSLRQSNIVFRMDEGLDNLYSALKVAEHIGLVKSKGKGYFILDEKYSGEALGGLKIHGSEKLRQHFKDNPKEHDMLLTDVKDYLVKRLEERNKKND